MARSTTTASSTRTRVYFISAMVATLVLIGGGLVLLFGPSTTTTLTTTNIPLTIHELLPTGETGSARTNELATFGIPLKDSDGITDVNQLGVTGSSTYQFRPLWRYPSGNIQWVLVDTLASVVAGGTQSMTLTTGTGGAGGANIATDNAAAVAITTGTAQFSIKKNGFNVLDSVIVGTTTVVAAGHTGGLVWVDGTGTTFSSEFDTPTVTVTENGPAKAIVKAVGRFKKSDGTIAPMGYTVYLTFVKGHADVKIGVTLSNSYDAVHARVKFRSVELVMPTALTGSKTFTLPTKAQLYTGTVASGQTAYLYQGFTIHNAGGEYGTSSNGQYEHEPAVTVTNTNGVYTGDIGTTVVNGANILKASGTDAQNDYALGWGQMVDGTGRTVTLAYKDMDGNAPASLEIADNGTMTIGVFSKRNPKSPLVFDWATDESRDLAIQFGTGAVSGPATYARIAQPLFGRADFTQYRDTGAFLDETRIASLSEQQTIYAANNRPDFAIANQPREVWRLFNFNQGGSVNQRDQALANQIDFVRTGHGGQMLNATAKAGFLADQFAWRSRDFDMGTKPYNILSTVDRSAGTPMNGGDFWNKHERDIEHIWVYGMYINYYMTGDDRIADGVTDLAESVYNMYQSADLNDIFSRGGMSAARMAMLGYRWNQDPKYLTRLDKYVTRFLAAKNNWPNGPAPYFGQQPDRGYVLFSNEASSTVQRVPSLMNTNYYPTVLYDIYKFTPPNHTFQSTDDPGAVFTRDDVGDALEGLAQFNYKELYIFSGTNRPTTPYYYNAVFGGANEDPDCCTYDAGIASAWAYEHTGDTSFLDKASVIMRWVDSWQIFIAHSEIGGLRALYDQAHRADSVTYVPVNATSTGNGNYTLSWTVPANTASYQLKYASNKTIVPNVNYNPATGIFQYPPAANISFWSAANVNNEPTPAAAGTIQTTTQTGLPCGTTCTFSLRAYGTSAVSPTPPLGPIGQWVQHPDTYTGIATGFVTAMYDPVTRKYYTYDNAQPGGDTAYLSIYSNGWSSYDPDTNQWALLGLSPWKNCNSGCTLFEPARRDSFPTDRHPYNYMVIAPERRTVVMHGGVCVRCTWPTTAALYDDTWEYSFGTNTWAMITGTKTDGTPLNSNPHPAHRNEGSMGYDPVAGKALLFGGFEVPASQYGEHWLYDLVTKSWTLFTPSGPVPPSRTGDSKDYDSKRKKILMYGGESDWDRRDLNDLWEFDVPTRTWTQIIPADSVRPSGRKMPQTAYDPDHDVLLMQGGNGPSGHLTDTWVFDFATLKWSDITATVGAVPTKQFSDNLVYDTDRHQFMYAGCGGNNAVCTLVYGTVSPLPDTTSPVMSAPAATSITSSGAVISWVTDDLSNSVVEYSVDTGFGSSRVQTTLTKNHFVTLSGLAAGTLYNFRVKSTNSVNLTTTSAPSTFTTAPDTTAPVILSGPTVSNVTITSATISWTTDDASTSIIEYSTDLRFRESVTDPNLVTSHTVTFSGLKSGSTYYYRVKSTNAVNLTTTSATFLFVMPVGPPPKGNACFPFGTLVATPSGSRPIGEVKVGDPIYAFDPASQQTVVSAVSKVLVHLNEPYGVVTFTDGTTLEVTATHRFYDPMTGGWRAIGSLHHGDTVRRGLGEAGQPLTIQSLEFTSRQGTVYNLEVDRYHDYYVQGILVHNAKQQQ